MRNIIRGGGVDLGSESGEGESGEGERGRGGGRSGSGRGGGGGGSGGEQVWSQMHVRLRYLVSYAHQVSARAREHFLLLTHCPLPTHCLCLLGTVQGTARVSCRDGCSCVAHVIDAHRPAFRESVQARKPVSQE